MSFTPGTRLGPYEIGARIGTGGMGEVYQATDTNLGRQVAIKVLPDSLATDPERLARFDREARTLAALNHPNIAAIYGVEKANRQTALVMELVEGPTLADRIAEGAAPVDDAVAIAKQIAEALEAAHEQGIVHRDLKPANVKLRPDGTVKVLDFGLAKLSESAITGIRSDPALSPTITSPAMTGVGVILGTAAYMAPEQAAGKAADKRADIWAFGVVLWEMLRGERLFASSESTSHVLADVLRAPISFDAIPDGPLQDLLRRCLDRNVKTRLRDIGEARIALSVPQTATGRSARDSRAATTAGARVAWAVAAALAVFSAVALWSPWRVEPERPLISLDVDLGPNVALPGRGAANVVALSPDESLLAYVASVSGGPSQIHVRRLNTREVTSLPGTEGAVSLMFSPDSRAIAYSSITGVYRVSVDGGTPFRLSGGPGRSTLSWGRDNSLLAWGQQQGLLRVPQDGSSPVEITKLADGEAIHAQPYVLPGGKGILFSAGGRTIDVVSSAGGDRKTIVREGTSARYLPSGHLLYLSQGTLFAVRFDLDALQTIGDPVPLVTDVKTSLQGQTPVGTFSMTENGTLVYRRETGPAATDALVQTGRVDLIDTAGRRIPLIKTPGVYSQLRFSPDGRQLAFTVRQSPRERDVWIYDRQSDRMTKVSFNGGSEAAWSRPDGRYLFLSGSNGGGIWWTRPGSSSPPQLLLASPAEIPWSVAPDGKRLAYYVRSAEEGRSGTGRGRGGVRIFTVPLTDEGGALKAGMPERFSPAQFQEYEAEFSPDGRWIALSTSRSGTGYDVVVRAFPLPATGQALEVQVSNNGGAEPRWSRTTRELLYVEGDRLMAAPYEIKNGEFVPGRPRVHIEKFGTSEWDLDPDGRIAVVTRIEQPAPAAAAPAAADHTVVLMQNFDAEVQRRVK